MAVAVDVLTLGHGDSQRLVLRNEKAPTLGRSGLLADNTGNVGGRGRGKSPGTRQ